MYYWRTSSGVEVDFVLYGAKALYAFEIKHSQTIHTKMLNGLKHFKRRLSTGPMLFIVSGAATFVFIWGEIEAIPFSQALAELQKLLCQA